MALVYRCKKNGEATFGMQRSISEEQNDEWYLLEAMHSSKLLVRESGEDDDERYELEAMHPSKTEAWCGDTQ